MKYKKLGKTDLKVSEIGFGTWPISGEGYGPTDDNVSIQTLNKALDKGINFIDTADSYGKGKSEELIGKVLSKRKDKETIVATKFGWDFYQSSGIKGNLEPKYINFALQHSLKRLKRDWIDIYQIHSHTPDNIIKFEVIETLEKLKEEGKIRYYGFSANYINDAIKLVDYCKLDTLQIPYNLIFPEAEKNLFAHQAIDNLGIICREPLANGFISGKYSIESSFNKKDHRHGFSKDKRTKLLNKVEQFRFLENNNISLCQKGISFCLQNKYIHVTISGLKNIKQLDEIILSAKVKLSSKELSQIESIHSSWI